MRSRLWTGVWGIEAISMFVRATFTDGTNVPRIPPLRLGGGLFWRDDGLARARQPAARLPAAHIALIGETPTQGYNDLRAEISYRWKPTRLTPDSLREVVVGLAGTNLLNDDIRNSVSVHQGRSADAGPRRSVLRQRQY